MGHKEIVKMYVKEQMTLREIAKELNTNHKKIGRILKAEGVAITKRNKLRVFTDEHKRKISEGLKGRKVWSEGKKMTRDHVLKNMKAHLRYEVSLEWLNKFEDVEKLKFLNRSCSRLRDCQFNSKTYIEFIEKFYIDKKFNKLYTAWSKTKDKWMRPSLDHISAKCKGGKLDRIDNLQFISWLENRAKADIDQTEWELIKKRIVEYF